MKQKGFASIYILFGMLILISITGAIYYYSSSANKPSLNIPSQVTIQQTTPPTNKQESSTTTGKYEQVRTNLPPKIDYKLPEGWHYTKNENPIVSEKPLWYSYGDVSNSSKVTSQKLSDIQKFTISILFYENTPGTNVSGIEEEGIHGGGNSLKYEKPEKIVLGDKDFTKQISYTPTAGRDYEGPGFHSPDDKIYTYSYSIDSDFLVFRFYYNINNPDKEKLLKDLDSFLSSFKIE